LSVSQHYQTVWVNVPTPAGAGTGPPPVPPPGVPPSLPNLTRFVPDPSAGAGNPPPYKAPDFKGPPDYTPPNYTPPNYTPPNYTAPKVDPAAFSSFKPPDNGAGRPFDSPALIPGEFDRAGLNGPGTLPSGLNGTGTRLPVDLSGPGTGFPSDLNGPGTGFPSGMNGRGTRLPGGAATVVPPPSSGRGNASPSPSEFKPGEGPNGAGVPGPTDTPRIPEWAAGEAPGSAGGSDRNAPAMPMMPGMPMAPGASGAGGGANAGERSDASGLIGGEVAPWTGAQVPGLGEPSGVGVASVSPEEWAVSAGERASSLPGVPMMPGAGAGAPGSGANAAERSDASGLLGGESAAWEGVDAPGLGDPSGVGEMGNEPEEWSVAGSSAQAVPGMPMMPMAPAPAQGANGAERSDASGLLGGESAAWDHEPVSALGDPGEIQTPPATTEPWVHTSVQTPQVPPVPAGPGEKRREEDGMGTTAFDFTAAPVEGTQPVVAAVEDRVPVVAPADDEDFSAWDTAAAGGLFWLSAGRPPKREDEEVLEKPDHTLRETTAWGHSAGREGAVRPQTPAEMAGRPMDVSAYLPSFTPHEYAVNSSDLDASENEEPDDEQDDSEEQEEERTSADLLKQDRDAWADSRPKAAPGVIE
jgi:hypothetical protein